MNEVLCRQMAIDYCCSPADVLDGRNHFSLHRFLPLIAKRIRNEEAVLEWGLAGYEEYKQRVKYKVIPGLW